MIYLATVSVYSQITQVKQVNLKFWITQRMITDLYNYSELSKHFTFQVQFNFLKAETCAKIYIRI
jgi:hypothetical protein